MSSAVALCQKLASERLRAKPTPVNTENLMRLKVLSVFESNVLRILESNPEMLANCATPSSERRSAGLF
jgi:hypothetical protein